MISHPALTFKAPCGYKRGLPLRAVAWALFLSAAFVPGGLLAQTDLPPATPTWISYGPVLNGIFLDWSDSTEADFNTFWVYRSTTPGTGYTVRAYALKRSSYTDVFVEPGVKYYYRVAATDLAGNFSPLSAEVSVTLPPNSPPATPLGLTTTGDSDSIYLSWSSNSEADLSDYLVYRTKTPGTNYEVRAYALTRTYYDDVFVEPGVTYYYSIAAKDTAGEISALSPEVSAMMGSGAAPTDKAPLAPTGLKATAGTGAIALDWNDNTEPDLASYSVYRSTTSGSGFALLARAVTRSDYSDSTAKAGTAYYYAVAAVDVAGHVSARSAQASATIPVSDVALAVPSGLTGTAATNSISLNWNDNTESDLAGYLVYRSTTSGTGFTPLAEDVTQSSYTDTAIQPGKTYYYIVFAFDTAGNTSAASAQVSVTAPAPPAGFVDQPVIETPDVPTTDGFASPVAAPLDISSTFGPRWKTSESRYDFHRGIDYFGNTGDPIFSIGGGTVTRIYPEGSVQFPNGGNTLIISYPLENPFPWKGITVDRIYAVYLHLDHFLVSVGDRVTTGQQVAAMGSTGDATIVHLHFEIRLQTTCSLEYQLANPTASCAQYGFDPHVHPFAFVGGENSDPFTIDEREGPPFVVIYETDRSDLDLGEVRTDLGTINFNLRTGIDASSTATLDNFDYGWVVIVPGVFSSTSTKIRYEFRFPVRPRYVQLTDIYGHGIRRTWS
jgi:murein DD-endopeptidase MepM/ murein hydrolase activator NlpD